MNTNEEVKDTTVESTLSKTQAFIEDNYKWIVSIFVIIIVVILGIFGARKWYFEPRQEKANAAIYGAEQLFINNQYQEALDGNDQYAGFLEVANSYGSTKAGNRAKYCAGLCYLHLGKYDEAVKYLKSYNGKDVFTPILATIAQGDAELERGNNSAALSLYEKAAKLDDNYVTTPYALFKAGMVYVLNNDGAKAKSCFMRIKEQYVMSTEYNNIDRYIAIAESL